MGRGPVVRAQREWAVSLASERAPLPFPDEFGAQLLIGDEEEREELGIQPKVMRIHGMLKFFAWIGTSVATTFTPQKWMWGIAKWDRESFEEFASTQDAMGGALLPRPYQDGGEGLWLMHGIVHLGSPWSQSWIPAGQDWAQHTVQPSCCQHKEVSVDVKVQRRLERQECLIYVAQHLSLQDPTAQDPAWDADFRMLVSQ